MCCHGWKPRRDNNNSKRPCHTDWEYPCQCADDLVCGLARANGDGGFGSTSVASALFERVRCSPHRRRDARVLALQVRATSRHAADPHSITSLACASSDCGTLRPTALAGLDVDHQLEFGRLLDRQVTRLRPLEDRRRSGDCDLVTSGNLRQSAEAIRMLLRAER